MKTGSFFKVQLLLAPLILGSCGDLERLPAGIGASQKTRRPFTDMTDAKCIEQTRQTNRSPAFYGGKEIADGGFAHAIAVLQGRFDHASGIAFFQRENITRFTDQAFLEEGLDLFFAEPLNVEGFPGRKMLQVFFLLERKTWVSTR